MKIAFLDPLEERLADFPKTYLGEHEVLTTDEAGKAPEGFEDAEALVWWTYPMDADVIERMPNLRFLQRIGILRTNGDTTAALVKGIPVSALPFGVSDRVAQHALMHTLAILRKLRNAYEDMAGGENPDNLPEAFQVGGGGSPTVNWTRTPDVDTLNDKTVGIIGYGEIGACLTRLIAPYNCRVLYHKRTRLSPDLESFFGVEYASMDDLLRDSDVVEAVLPYSESTRKLIGAREFALMKPKAVFVNVGRGNTLDEEALIEGLKQGKPAFAGLDVFSIEPLPADHPLHQLPNAFLTPHTAGGINGWINTFERIAENLRRVEAGRAPILPVSRGDPQWP